MENVKATLNDRINAIENAYFKGVEISEEDFMFLIERAHKSVRPARKASDKPSKASLEHQAKAAEVAQYVAEHGAVTCKDIQDAFGVSNQAAARLLRDAPGLVKTAAKGKVKATWSVA